MKKKIVVSGFIVVAVVSLVITGAWYVYTSEQKPVEIVGSIDLGFVAGEGASGIYVADELDLFAANGINVTLHPVVVGLDWYKAMLKGEIDISGPTEYVVVGGGLRHEEVSIISSIVNVDLHTIIGRRDHGIETASDLSGKRIGVLNGTISEFFLGRFLDLHGIQRDNVTFMNMNFTNAVESLKTGAIDAVITIPPFDDSIRSSLGAISIEWPAQNNQWVFGVLTSRNDWLTQNSHLVIRLLKAINQANEYISEHPAEAKIIVKKKLNVDEELIDKMWRRNIYTLSLDQSLILALEDEARWMIQNNLTTEKQVPNFLDFIYEEPLKSVKSEAVNIIH